MTRLCRLLTIPAPAATKKKAGRPAKDASVEAPEKKPAKPAAATKKRKATEEPETVPVKKAKVVAKGPVINEQPTERLNVYVFGEGSCGELGLGTAKNAIDVKRPRLNPNLPASSVGVVQVAAGAMHVIALTHDNKILTWGVNDQGALGRDTTWDGGLKDMDADDDDSDSEDDDAGLNPKESTPTAIRSDKFPDDTVFVQVVAGDSQSFALTDDGQVWGWGTFRVSDTIRSASFYIFLLICHLEQRRYLRLHPRRTHPARAPPHLRLEENHQTRLRCKPCSRPRRQRCCLCMGLWPAEPARPSCR